MCEIQYIDMIQYDKLCVYVDFTRVLTVDVSRLRKPLAESKEKPSTLPWSEKMHIPQDGRCQKNKLRGGWTKSVLRFVTCMTATSATWFCNRVKGRETYETHRLLAETNTFDTFVPVWILCCHISSGHRDIKPGNFMLSVGILPLGRRLGCRWPTMINWRPVFRGQLVTRKLSDFGFARFLQKGQKCWENIGTPAFMAPEQQRLKSGSSFLDRNRAIGQSTILEWRCSKLQICVKCVDVDVPDVSEKTCSYVSQVSPWGEGYGHPVDVWAAGCTLHMCHSCKGVPKGVWVAVMWERSAPPTWSSGLWLVCDLNCPPPGRFIW